MVLVVDEALLLEPGSWQANFDELVDLESDGRWCGRTRGELYVSVDPTNILVRGELEARIPRECDLCLAHYLEPVEARLGEVCLIGAETASDTRADGADAGDASWDDDAEAWHVGLGGRLDLTEMVRQSILLALPTRATCGSGCTGAALGSTGRSAAAVDPRLAILQRLMKNEGEDHGLS